MPFIAVTYTKPRPGITGIDSIHITGESAKSFLVNFKNIMGHEPEERTEYNELGLRVDRIER
jgi:hypothetical protein